MTWSTVKSLWNTWQLYWLIFMHSLVWFLVHGTETMCKYRYRSRYTRTTHYTNQRVTDKQENNCYIYCNIHCFRSVQNICSIAMSTFSWIIQISIGRQDRGGCLHDNHRTKVQKSIILFLLLLSHKCCSYPIFWTGSLYAVVPDTHATYQNMGIFPLIQEIITANHLLQFLQPSSLC